MVYAGFWRRAGGVLLDGLIMIIPAMLMSFVLPYVGGLIFGFLYIPFFMSSEMKATPGMAVMGVSVVQLNGERIDFQRALVRYLLTFVSGALLMIGYLFNLFTPKRQTLHDMIAGTVVVRVADVQNVNWWDVWLREFKRVFNFDIVPAAAGTGGNVFSSPEPYTASSSSPVAAASVDAATVTATLETLHRLFQQGVLTEAEYSAKKEELLKKI